jgi:hypothetical protein
MRGCRLGRLGAKGRYAWVESVAMDEAFVVRANVERFQRLLAGSLDGEKRRLVQSLLAAEIAKLPDAVKAEQSARRAGGPRRS